PTPLAATLLCAPKTRMDILTPKEIDSLVQNSDIARFYNEDVDRESAYEMLKKKMEAADEDEHREKIEEQKRAAEKVTGGRTRTTKEKSLVEEVTKNTMVRQVGRTIFRELTRGLLGALGIGKR
ncbi:MAG: DUF853 domain-containing protein, partial [Flavobacteriales bacterium]|nr:DUF853 domain-containing protein [Flavobacteriales bacterium]